MKVIQLQMTIINTEKTGVNHKTHVDQELIARILPDLPKNVEVLAGLKQ